MEIILEGSRGMTLGCQVVNWEPMWDGWVCLLQVPQPRAASCLPPTPLGFQPCSEVLDTSVLQCHLCV